MCKWKRWLIFLGVEGITLFSKYQNDKRASDKKKSYVAHTNDHWDFARWIHDYYKWYEYKEGELTWNAIRGVFINDNDTLYGCAQDPTQEHCYFDIWDNAHNCKLTWEGETVQTNRDEFKYIFQELCGNNHPFQKECLNSIDEVQQILDSKSVEISMDIFYYEGIAKYNLFFAGWDDNDSANVEIYENGDKIINSNNKNYYQQLWHIFWQP